MRVYYINKYKLYVKMKNVAKMRQKLKGNIRKILKEFF